MSTVGRSAEWQGKQLVGVALPAAWNVPAAQVVKAGALAKRLLTYAFAADVLETIDIAPVRASLEALSLARFTGSEA